MVRKRLPSVRTTDTEKAVDPIARRVFLERSAGLLVFAGIAAGGLQSANATEKYSKDEVEYQTSPKDGQSCANCQFWDGNGGCEIVAGEFALDDWCSVWVEA